jgi:hypothetical protein
MARRFSITCPFTVPVAVCWCDAILLMREDWRTLCCELRVTGCITYCVPVVRRVTLAGRSSRRAMCECVTIRCMYGSPLVQHSSISQQASAERAATQ